MAGVAFFVTVCSVVLHWNLCGADYYTDQWAVYIKGGEHVAHSIAQKHGFVYVTKVGVFDS